MRLGDRMVSQLLHDASRGLVWVIGVAEHSVDEPGTCHLVTPSNRLLALAYQGRAILGDNRLPDRDGGRIALYLLLCSTELFENPVRWYASELWIDWAQT